MTNRIKDSEEKRQSVKDPVIEAITAEVISRYGDMAAATTPTALCELLSSDDPLKALFAPYSLDLWRCSSKRASSHSRTLTNRRTSNEERRQAILLRRQDRP